MAKTWVVLRFKIAQIRHLWRLSRSMQSIETLRLLENEQKEQILKVGFSRCLNRPFLNASCSHSKRHVRNQYNVIVIWEIKRSKYFSLKVGIRLSFVDFLISHLSWMFISFRFHTELQLRPRRRTIPQWVFFALSNDEDIVFFLVSLFKNT